jgi:hypothetical protein
MKYEKMTKTQLIEEIGKIKEIVPKTVISNNTFTSTVEWDEKSTESINLVAKALLNITELFKSQNIEICALKITGKDE